MLEARGLGAAALRTGPVPGSERSRLVEKEELGVRGRRHHLALPSLELEKTDYPGLSIPVAFLELALRTVNAPPIAHERSPLRDRNNLAKWRNAILYRHDAPRDAQPKSRPPSNSLTASQNSLNRDPDSPTSRGRFALGELGG